MHMQPLRLRFFAFVAGVAVLAFSSWASADPPSRVARLGYTSGAVSFSPAGENDWVQARINRPMTNGDRLWTDARARAEIQVGGAVIRMSAHTGLSVLNLDDRIAQLQVTQGILNIRVRRLDPNQVFEVNTPNLAFTVRRPGEYRIEVDPDGDATTIDVRSGEGEAYGDGAAYVIDSRQPYRFTGTGLREYEYLEVPHLDEFDRWASSRDRRYDNSSSARYVSRDVVGYEDLDANGTWRSDATYGNVWFPNRVASGWAPYRNGHWAWIDPWGWTWMDDAPWGYAVSHYGRWTSLGGNWGWVPGPVRTRAYYAPALVAFVGGDNFRISISSGNVGGVAWFPLAPREVYRPSYAVSRGYFENVNYSNTVINNTVINNYYNNSIVTNVVYANRHVPGAIVAVPSAAFVQSQPVSRVAVQVSREMIVSAPVAMVPRLAPTERSVRGAAIQSEAPPPRMFDRPVVVRTAPPAAHVGFAAQQQQLTARPGSPLDEAARRELRPASNVPAPVVRIVAPAQTVQPTALPPPVASVGRVGGGRGNYDDRMAPAAPAVSGARTQVAPPAPVSQPMEQRGRTDRGRGDSRDSREPSFAPPQSPRSLPQSAAPAAPPQVVPQAPVAQPREQRGRPDQRNSFEQRGQPIAPPPSPPQSVAPAAPPQFVPQAPSAQPREQRGRPDQRDSVEQRGQPVAQPPLPPQSVAPVAPPQVVPQAPAAQPREQRGRPDQRGGVEQRGQPFAAPPQVVLPQGAPPTPAAPQRAKSEPAPVTSQIESRPPSAVSAPPPPQPVPRADPRGAGKADDRKKDKDEKQRDEDERKQRE